MPKIKTTLIIFEKNKQFQPPLLPASVASCNKTDEVEILE